MSNSYLYEDELCYVTVDKHIYNKSNNKLVDTLSNISDKERILKIVEGYIGRYNNLRSEIKILKNKLLNTKFLSNTIIETIEKRRTYVHDGKYIGDDTILMKEFNELNKIFNELKSNSLSVPSLIDKKKQLTNKLKAVVESEKLLRDKRSLVLSIQEEWKALNVVRDISLNKYNREFYKTTRAFWTKYDAYKKEIKDKWRIVYNDKKLVVDKAKLLVEDITDNTSYSDFKDKLTQFKEIQSKYNKFPKLLYKQEESLSNELNSIHRKILEEEHKFLLKDKDYIKYVEKCKLIISRLNDLTQDKSDTDMSELNKIKTEWNLLNKNKVYFTDEVKNIRNKYNNKILTLNNKGMNRMVRHSFVESLKDNLSSVIEELRNEYNTLVNENKLVEAEACKKKLEKRELWMQSVK